MIVDTDVLIWYLRGNEQAQSVLTQNLPFSISVVTQMELLQGMRSKRELKILQQQWQKWSVSILHITPEISTRAMFYVQSYALSHGMQMADALIAATALQTGYRLLTANTKHYRFIPEIEIAAFQPEDK